MSKNRKYLPKQSRLIRFNIIGIVSAAVSAAIAIAFGVYSFGGFSQQLADNVPLLNNPLNSTLQDVDTKTSSSNPNVDTSLVNRLMIEEGLNQDTATLVAQIDTQINTYNSTYLSYEQTLPGQAAWDVQIRAIPDQVYIPTEAELQAAAAGGNKVYDLEYSFEEIGGIPQLTISYFVPYEAMSEELKASIQPSSSGSSAAAMVGSLPAAEASEGASGAVIQTIIKSLAKEGINKLVGTDLSTIFAALEVAIGEYKASQSKSYFSELDQLRECAENPTNPLTKKTYQENPSEKAKIVDQINEAESQVNQLTAARLLNLVAKTGAKFTGANFAGKLFFDAVAKWNDETLKEVAEGWIDDAKKGVVECEQPATGLIGSIQYRFSRSDKGCTGGDENCYEIKEQKSGSGTFSLTTRGDAIIGNGTGNYDQTRTKVITKRPSDPLTEYNGEYNFVTSGAVQIKVEGAQSPIVRLSVNGAGLLTEEGSSTNYVLNYGDSRVTAVQNEVHRDTTGGFVCSFEGVDLVKGGTYEVDVMGGDDGSCKLVLSPT